MNIIKDSRVEKKIKEFLDDLSKDLACDQVNIV
jgi:hypothetical protein